MCYNNINDSNNHTIAAHQKFCSLGVLCLAEGGVLSSPAIIASVVIIKVLHDTHTGSSGLQCYALEPVCAIRYIPCSIRREFCSGRIKLRGFPLIGSLSSHSPLSLLFHHFSVSQPSHFLRETCAFKSVHVMHVQDFM